MIVQHDSLTQEERDFLLAFEDDTNESPWEVVTDFLRNAVYGFLFPLKRFAAKQHPEWYISSRLPVLYPRPDGTTGQVAPDVFVARAANYLHDYFHVEEEGAVPAFVLECVSSASAQRDTQDKVRFYGLFGVEEYVLFDPCSEFDPYADHAPQLHGYHRAADGTWAPWPLGSRGELQSAVLGLTLIPHGQYLWLQDAQGESLISVVEELEQQVHEERSRHWRAEDRLDEEVALRTDLEARLAAVEAELARLRG